MTKSEHLLFLALMLPTVLLLVLAAVSLAEPDVEPLVYPPTHYVHAAEAVDGAGHETAY